MPNGPAFAFISDSFSCSPKVGTGRPAPCGAEPAVPARALPFLMAEENISHPLYFCKVLGTSFLSNGLLRLSVAARLAGYSPETIKKKKRAGEPLPFDVVLGANGRYFVPWESLADYLDNRPLVVVRHQGPRVIVRTAREAPSKHKAVEAGVSRHPNISKAGLGGGAGTGVGPSPAHSPSTGGAE